MENAAAQAPLDAVCAGARRVRLNVLKLDSHRHNCRRDVLDGAPAAGIKCHQISARFIRPLANRVCSVLQVLPYRGKMAAANSLLSTTNTRTQLRLDHATEHLPVLRAQQSSGIEVLQRMRRLFIPVTVPELRGR